MESPLQPGWWSVIPPLLAIVLAVISRQVILSLGFGIWVGYCLLAGVGPLAGLGLAIDGVLGVFRDAGDTRVLIFTLLIGGLIATMEQLGGVRGFVRALESRRWVRGPKGAQWLAYCTGMVVFIESNITLLVSGTIARPLFDRYRLAREKLAYIIDSTSAPVCILIPVNAWGAVVLGLLEAEAVGGALAVFVAAIPLNLYPLIVIVCCAIVIWRRLDVGPMRGAQQRADKGVVGAAAVAGAGVAAKKEQGSAQDKARYMLLPVAVMLLSVFLGLYITGRSGVEAANAAAYEAATNTATDVAAETISDAAAGVPTEVNSDATMDATETDGGLQGLLEILGAGSGSTAVLWAVLLALLTAWLLSIVQRRLGVNELMNTLMKGAGGLLPVATILLFALALGDVADDLGTGIYVAGVVRENLDPIFMPSLLFLVSSVIAFSIGSSWGTFAIMIPLAMQVVLGLGPAGDGSASLFLAAVLSGAVFGDHASPISDTTVVASLASGTDHIDHVRTQLPYALFCALLAALGFLLIGQLLMS